MDRSKVKQLRIEMNKALKELGEKHGLAIEVGNIRYDDQGFNAKVKAIEANPNDQDSIDRAKFERDVMRMFGIGKEDFHREFVSEGTSFKVVGVKPRARKYPIIGEDENGTRYKFPLSILQKG